MLQQLIMEMKVVLSVSRPQSAVASGLLSLHTESLVLFFKSLLTSN